MKKISVLILALMVFFSISSNAQKGRGAASKQTLMDSLKISSTTADSVIAIRDQSESQIREIMKDQSLSQEQKKEQVRPIREDAKHRLEKVLTKEQMAKLQEMGMERREEMKNRQQ